jgi:hypothetical protein
MSWSKATPKTLVGSIGRVLEGRDPKPKRRKKGDEGPPDDLDLRGKISGLEYATSDPPRSRWFPARTTTVASLDSPCCGTVTTRPTGCGLDVLDMRLSENTLKNRVPLRCLPKFTDVDVCNLPRDGLLGDPESEVSEESFFLGEDFGVFRGESCTRMSSPSSPILSESSWSVAVDACLLAVRGHDEGDEDRRPKPKKRNVKGDLLMIFSFKIKKKNLKLNKKNQIKLSIQN